MSFSHLSLVNFRNYVRLEVDLPPGVTILEGANGQGKTNFLEALYFVATTKSPRAVTDRELLYWGTLAQDPPFARVSAVARRQTGPAMTPSQPLRIEITLVVRNGVEGSVPVNLADATVVKRIRVNGLPRRAIELIGQVKVVMFGPLDIDLVAGAPAARRRYLDITNSQIDRRYVRALQQYNRVILQRNHLLRHLRDRHGNVDQLAYWDQLLADHGSYIVWQRRRMVTALNGLLSDLFPTIIGSHSQLRVEYTSTVPESFGDEADVQQAIAAALRERLEAVRDRELAQGVSLVGPHRDDLTMFVDGIDMRLYGSRGQQRTVALAIKLAEALYIEEETGDVPVLLLDDVMSELDAIRRQHLLSAVQRGQQVILTTTDLNVFQPDFLAAATIFHVEHGVLQLV